jgi:hypothetical protein
MNCQLFSVVLDCPDPHALARFYAQLLELPVTRAEPDWAEVGGSQAGRCSPRRSGGEHGGPTRPVHNVTPSAR